MESFLGALIGAWSALLMALFVPKIKYQLAMSDKMAERRISAHEDAISVALSVRVMCPVEKSEDRSSRSPEILSSQKRFHDWFFWYQNLVSKGTTWLSLDAKKELNFFQDYMYNLMITLENKSDDTYIKVGEVIRQDFIDISSSLEKSAFKYFEKDIHKLKNDSFGEWHKYNKAITGKRLSETLLFVKCEEIKSIIDTYK